MDLMKIAQDNTMTYLEKTAALVDGFANGEISGEDADAIAQEAGIALSDLEGTFHAAYGDVEKTASEQDLPENLEKFAADDASYLVKVASLVDAVVCGEIDIDYADALAKEAGLDDSDIEAVFEAAYGQEDALSKIANDDSQTYLEKCAQIADAFEGGEISGVEADAVAMEIGIAPEDVLGVHTAAYGDIEKEAGARFDAATEAVKKGAKYVGDKAKKFSGFDDAKSAKATNDKMKGFSEAGKKGDGYQNLRSQRNVSAAKAAGKAIGTTAIVGGTGYGASKLFGKKEEEK